MRLTFDLDKSIPMTHPNHPCLIVGSEERPQFFPASICEIIQGQSFRHPIPNEALVKVNEFKKISTHKVNPSSRLSGDQNLVNLISEASSLGALSLHRHGVGGLSLNPEQVRCQKVFKAAPYPPLTLSAFSRTNFRVVFVEVGNAPAMSKAVEASCGL